ncbi:MAG: hypothetical protein LPJ93_06980 [Rhodobacterales bacterium]|nr:hypothetical protein [Rhodobacterales bacterium]
MRRLLGVLLLGGCAALPGTPVPQEARLSAEVLTLVLSDGTVCQADWAASGGAGRFEACVPGFAYAVEVVENPNPLRQVVQALVGEGALAPMARVVITDAAGRAHVFASPPRREPQRD